MEEYYLICEDSLEGIFSGVYQAYLQKYPLERVHLIAGEEEKSAGTYDEYLGIEKFLLTFESYILK